MIAPDDQVQPDLYATPSNHERAAWLSALGFQYVVLHKFSTSNIYDWRGQRPAEQVEVEKQHLTALLSAPIYEDQWIIAFQVPAGEILEPDAQPLIAFTHGWTDVQRDDQGHLYRRMAQEATLDVYAPAARAYRLAFDASSPGGPHPISVSLDGQEFFTATVDQAETYLSPPVDLRSGRNTLVFKTAAPCQPDGQICQALTFLRLDWSSP